MMNSKILMLILGAAIASNAAMIKEVKLDCKSSKCGLTFQFTNADDLPSFYQKYDASARTLTLGFSDTKPASYREGALRRILLLSSFIAASSSNSLSSQIWLRT